MMLIVGGRGAGKRALAMELGYGPEDMADAVLDGRPVLYNLQDLVWKDPEAAQTLLPELVKREIVICDEVGSGIIPLAQQDRAAREAVGRLCVLLAGEAHRVVRVVCGMPQVIKGDPLWK